MIYSIGFEFLLTSIDITCPKEKALDYGAWGGGEPEDPNPGRKPNEPDMTPPEILTFVGMPADLIEALARLFDNS